MSLQEELHYEAPQGLTPETELAHLRERVKSEEAQAKSGGSAVSREAITSKVLTEYAKQKPEDALVKEAVIDNPQFESIVRSVDALPHREKIRELYGIMQEKGILNAVKIAEGLNNPHVEEDFHHVLVHYVHTGALPPGLDKERELKEELAHTVYEVIFPLAKEAKEVNPQEVLAAMQRFLAGTFGEGAGSAPFAFEIALANFSSDITFYVAVPDSRKDLFLKQFLGNFPTARATEVIDDYNVFNEFGATAIAVASHEKRFAYALAVPKDSLESLSPILAAYEKIAHAGEAVSLQYIVRKDDRGLLGKVRGAIGKMRGGTPMSKATDIPLSTAGTAFKVIGSIFASEEKPKELTPEGKEKLDREIKVIEEKISAPFLRVDLRIVASAGDRERALEIVTALAASFGQFKSPESSGGLHFDIFSSGSRFGSTIHDFTYRAPTDDALVLNFNEFSGLFHPPLALTAKEAPNVAQVRAAVAPPPAQLPEEGTILGDSVYRGERRTVRMTKQDRLRHLYVIGQTGTGKTTIMKNMIVEDIKNGEGCCFIDPHGSDVQDILANIPKERIDDVIYFDPSYMARPFGLNMLEYDESKPEQKIFVVNELFAIFKKLYSSSPESMGPAFEQYFRNATMLVMEDPESGSTMLEIVRVMADSKFRELKLSRCKNPIVVQFWRDIATKTTGEAGLQNMIPYITNKFDVFISNDIMRPIIAQEKSSFNFRDIMDNKKILLVNLAKGKLGEMNANLLGMIIVGKLFLAAMSRVDSYGIKLPDFYLYIDEFQNISTPSIAGILSEARKYGLSLNIAHQFIAQIDDDIKEAVFGNVGSMAVFRISADDAQYLESQFAPTFTATDLMKIESRNCYLKPLIDGKPVPPFNVAVRAPSRGVPEIVPQLQELSYMKYGRDRKRVDDEIIKKYQSTSAANQAAQAKPAVPAPTASPRPIAPVVPAMQQQPAPAPIMRAPQAPDNPYTEQRTQFASPPMQQAGMPPPQYAYPQQMPLQQMHPVMPMYSQPPQYAQPGYPPAQQQIPQPGYGHPQQMHPAMPVYPQQQMPPQYAAPQMPQQFVPHGPTAPYMYPPAYPPQQVAPQYPQPPQYAQSTQGFPQQLSPQGYPMQQTIAQPSQQRPANDPYREQF